MKVLVTGGAGFIGSNLVEELVKIGHEVTVLDNFFMGKKENLASVIDKITLIEGDIRNKDTVDSAVKGKDFIFNQAAASSSPLFFKDLRDAVSVNVDGFINILNAAKDSNVKRVIYASTSSIYGNIPGALKEDMKVIPPNFYSVTKLANENLAQLFTKEYGLGTVGFRYMSVYGPKEESKGIYANLASQFLWEMKKGNVPVIYGDGTQTRDFTFVKDVANANIMAMDMSKKIDGEIFNVGTGNAITLNELVKKINKTLGTEIKPAYVENKIKNYIATQMADTKKTKNLLGFSASHSVEDGLGIINQ